VSNLTISALSVELDFTKIENMWWKGFGDNAVTTWTQ